MRLAAPRLAPLDIETLDDEQREVLAPFLARGPILNIFLALARAPKAMTGLLKWANYILSGGNALAPRDRELVILRTGANCRSGYEWTQHVRIGCDAGLSDAEIEFLKEVPEAVDCDDRGHAMLRAVDDLTGDFFVSTKSSLALDFLSERQKMDLVLTVGQYTQVSMLLNSFGVQLETGNKLDSALTAYEPAA